LKRAKMPFSSDPATYAAHVIPSMDDWHGVWAAWDTVTRAMIPEQELNEKPIKLRNACIFYLGHIPTFLDIQLTKTTGTAPTEPAAYAAIFERGIDPDVDNPERCHDHSEIPEEWPPLADILAYQDRVRERLTSLYKTVKSGEESGIPRRVGRAIWLGFEHELMHLETLLYMLLQSDKTLPPPHTERPDFERMAREAAAARVSNQWFDVPEQTVNIGLDDPENGVDSTRHFGW
jgi:L-histidine Nalpha-methyltransferase / hercynylcysteine S-oxide synthase